MHPHTPTTPTPPATTTHSASCTLPRPQSAPQPHHTMSHCDMSISRPRRRSSRRWPWSQHAPSPIWCPQTGARHTTRTGTTHGHQRPAARPPPYDFIEFRPPLPTQPPPSTTRLESPQTHRARVLHARNASVTLAIRHLGMKTRRTSYRTAKSTCTLCVSDFWSEGPKRQRKWLVLRYPHLLQIATG